MPLDRFLSEIQAATRWLLLVAEIGSFYPMGEDQEHGTVPYTLRSGESDGRQVKIVRA